MIEFGWFTSHSKFQLPWKVECDSFTDNDWESIAKIIAWKFAFHEVVGVPRGGVKLATALQKHRTSGYPLLIVDDVLTSGKSMIEEKAKWVDYYPDSRIIGVVVFARGKCPDWVWPIFTVNEWAQSRATGLG